MLGVFSANISFHNWFQGQVAGTPQMRKVKESVTPVLPSRSFAWPYTEVSSAAAGAVVCSLCIGAVTQWADNSGLQNHQKNG